MSDSRVVVLDFDGTVVDSLPVKGHAFRDLFLEHGEDFADRVLEHHNRNVGLSRYKKFEEYYRWLGRDIEKRDMEYLDNTFSELVVQKVIEASDIPGAPEFIQAISSRYPLYIVSAAPKRELDVILEKRGLAEYTTNVFGAPRSKQESLLCVARNESVAGSKLYCIGDSLSDYRAALSVGAHFIALNFSDTVPEDIEHSVPDFNAPALQKLFKL